MFVCLQVEDSSSTPRRILSSRSSTCSAVASPVWLGEISLVCFGDFMVLVLAGVNDDLVCCTRGAPWLLVAPYTLALRILSTLNASPRSLR